MTTMYCPSTATLGVIRHRGYNQSSEDHSMPLRDHFRPPVSRQASWEGFHGYWPAAIVRTLSDLLPPGFVAEPRVHLGSFFEIDVSTYAEDEAVSSATKVKDAGGAIATAAWAPPAPSFAVDAEIPDQYDYEVLIYDAERGRQLVAAVEIVSPANKDRPENRQVFIVKCAGLLRKGVCVSIIDLVTVRHFNLYAELLAFIGRSDPSFSPVAPPTYAASCRLRLAGRKSRLETWSHALAVGQPLPTLPIWLTETRAIALELEASYEETCRVLRIP